MEAAAGWSQTWTFVDGEWRGERMLQPGPLCRKARELYWAFAHDGRRI